MLKSRRFKVISVSFLLGISVLITLGFNGPTNRYFEIVKNLDLFANLYKEVNEYYVDDINPSQLMNNGVEAMLSELDPYTVYISEDKIESFRTMNTGQYAGIGASTITLEGRMFVSMVYKGFSAYENGLRIGDEIIQINGQEIVDLSPERVSQMIKGQVKTEITLNVKDVVNQEIKNIKFEREKVTIPNVPYAGMIEGDIAYIKFTEFTPNGYKNIKSELQKLLKDDAQGLILDLRGNLGGLLEEAVDISNLFLEADLEVVHTKGKVKANSFFRKTKYNPIAAELPLVVLIDKMSASASEIVAGTLQDYDRAVLIGHKTYGKGLVQNTRNLPYNSKVKMTIAKYYIPSGRCVQAVDYSNRNPDGSVGKLPDSLKVAFKTRNGRTVYDGGGIDPEIKIDNDQGSSLAQQLMQKGYIFKYANEFKKTNSGISEARLFDLTDEQYNEFSKWLISTNFKFENSLVRDLDKLKLSGDNLGISQGGIQILDDIDGKLNAGVDEMLNMHREEIKKILEIEIASRYYLQAGSIEAGLGDDKSIEKAIDILRDKDSIATILSTVEQH